MFISKILNNLDIENQLDEAVELHDQLNPKIWNEDNKLLPEVREKVIEIARYFKDQLKEDNVDLSVKDIYILGSNANYNYNDQSDLDIHLIVDESFDCSKKHLPIIYDAYKALFNKKYDIAIKGINAEIYVENKDNLTNVSSGIYSLKNDDWIRKPSRYEIPEIDEFKLNEEINYWESKYFNLVIDPTIERIDKFIDALYDMRQKSISKDGEFGIGNLVFKELRRCGYLDELKELKIQLENDRLSLNA